MFFIFAGQELRREWNLDCDLDCGLFLSWNSLAALTICIARLVSGGLDSQARWFFSHDFNTNLVSRILLLRIGHHLSLNHATLGTLLSHPCRANQVIIWRRPSEGEGFVLEKKLKLHTDFAPASVSAVLTQIYISTYTCVPKSPERYTPHVMPSYTGPIYNNGVEYVGVS